MLIKVSMPVQFKMIARPKWLEFPKVWRRFKVEDPSSGNLIEYRIQDIPEEHYNTVLDQLVRHYLADEPRSKILKYLDDETSVEEFKAAIRDTLPQKLSIGCFKEGSTDLLGYHSLFILHKDDPPANLKGRARRIQYNLTKTGLERAKIFEKHRVDCILSELGLSVDPAYRRLGIASELLKARVQVTKAIGLKVTAGGFSVIGSQKAALNAGYIQELEITAEQLPALGFDLEGSEMKNYVVMSGIVE